MARRTHILIAEDEENDALLMQMAVQKAGLRHTISIVRDGQQAVDYLSGAPPFNDRSQHPLPEIFLLDLKMPRLTGFDVLQWLTAHPELSELPAIVISSSIDVSDMEKARDLGAADYYFKPTRFADLVKLIADIQESWLNPAVPA